MRTELGATRRVFIFKRFVVKVPSFKEYRLFLNGILANLQEKTFSGSHSDLAKVLFCSPLGLFLVMEKAEVVSNGVDWAVFKRQLKAKYAKDEMKEFMLSDSKPGNWGYIGNKLIKIDYGN